MLGDDYECLKNTDIISMDRGYLDRLTINEMKEKRGTSVVIPAKSNMNIFKRAVEIAKEENNWKKHPNHKREKQEIHLVKGLGELYVSEKNMYKKVEKEDGKDVDLNACVIRIPKDEDTETEVDITYEEGEYKYIVLITSDLSLSGAAIVRAYETRCEIEEDFRQLKENFGIQKFSSTQYVKVVFQIVMTLLAYSVFILYKNTEEGRKYKNHDIKTSRELYRTNKKMKYRELKDFKIIVTSEDYFGLYDIFEFMSICRTIPDDAMNKIEDVIKGPIL